MKLAFPDLLAPVTLPGTGDALQSWRWRTGSDAAPWLVTALGDVFVRAHDGRISFLDTYVGQLSEAAAANTDWTRALQNPGNLEQWFESFKGPLGFELHNVRIVPGEPTAFCHYLGLIVGAGPGGRISGYWIRGTVCFERRGQRGG